MSSWARHRGVRSTRGCPLGLTVGPCNEWQERMWTSFGRCASKAAFSGALTDVWPATIAFTFVANIEVSWHLGLICCNTHKDHIAQQLVQWTPLLWSRWYSQTTLKLHIHPSEGRLLVCLLTDSMVNWAFKPQSKDRSVLEKSILSFSYFSGRSQTKILGVHKQVSADWHKRKNTQTFSNQLDSGALRTYSP